MRNNQEFNLTTWSHNLTNTGKQVFSTCVSFAVGFTAGLAGKLAAPIVSDNPENLELQSLIVGGVAGNHLASVVDRNLHTEHTPVTKSIETGASFVGAAAGKFVGNYLQSLGEQQSSLSK